MKSVSLQSLYLFCGKLPDVLFRMEKYSFDLEVTEEEYCSYFAARLLSINAVFYSFLLQLSL